MIWVAIETCKIFDESKNRGEIYRLFEEFQYVTESGGFGSA